MLECIYDLQILYSSIQLSAKNNSYICVWPRPSFFLHLDTPCEDTPSWDNGEGKGCDFYATNPMKCTRYPEYYNRPDINCCACKGDCKYIS